MPALRLAGTQRAFAFCDLVDCSTLAARLGDRRFAALIIEHNAIVRGTLEGLGDEAHFLGDGFMLTFPRAAAAVRWAVAAQRELAARLPSVRARIGLHCGTAVEVDGSWLGRDVIVARRLCESAEPGEILASARLRALVTPWPATGGPAFTGSRELGLKGCGDPLGACSVRWR